eukprot:TRINITY_DN115130_c0_g1_i1.p1 TRINITY_DN115130_c0_g1~~TRINITY_DN115130_c0_g1_i1.p1  ORF type:complete len:220 (-),score=27.22 TRINITY_DN115130_c0_g1_i1:72-731(-)
MHRRCFKTHALPHMFACQVPFAPCNGHIPPKIIVLVADPRHVLVLWWQVLNDSFGHENKCLHVGLNIRQELGLNSCLELASKQHSDILFGGISDHFEAWANVASAHPEIIRLCRVDRLGSLDKSDVASELVELAQFLETHEDGAAALANAIFSRPEGADRALPQDLFVNPSAVKPGGHLVEIAVMHQSFNVLDRMVQSRLQTKFAKLFDADSPCLLDLA